MRDWSLVQLLINVTIFIDRLIVDTANNNHISSFCVLIYDISGFCHKIVDHIESETTQDFRGGSRGSGWRDATLVRGNPIASMRQ